jgi:hypothetical protein
MKKFIFDETKKVILGDDLTLQLIINSFASIGTRKVFIDPRSGHIITLKGAKESLELVGTLVSRITNIKNISNVEKVFILDSLCVMNTYNRIERGRDLLADFTVINQNLRTGVISIVEHGLPKANVQTPRAEKEYDQFIRQYEELFPFVESLVRSIIYAKVAPIKESFYYIVGKSNFGKSFQLSALRQAGLGFELEDIQSFASNSNSSSISIRSLVDASCVLVDEFMYFTKELKNITFHTSLAEKYGMSQDVPLGLKIMYSANLSDSLIGGVDAQLLNRVALIQVETSHGIDTLPIIKKIGTNRGRDLLAFFFYELAKETIKSLKEKEDPIMYATAYLKGIFREYKIGNNTDLVEDMEKTLTILIEDAVKEMHFNDPAIIELNDGKVFLKKPVKTIMSLIDTQTDPVKAMKFKSYVETYVRQSPHVDASTLRKATRLIDAIAPIDKKKVAKGIRITYYREE